MELLLQIWGGGCYLLNKIFLSRSEGKLDGRTVRIWGWAVYLLGLPAWVIILVMKRDWMAATIEAGGAPAMLLGLMAAMKGLERAPQAADETFGMVCLCLDPSRHRLQPV
jgi:hypothetical protein